MIDVLMPVRLDPFVCDTLARSTRLHRLWEAPDEDALLAGIAPDVRCIVTSAGILALGPARNIDRAFIEKCPKLELIASLGVGYDHVDAAFAASRGIVVTNTPDVLTDETADTALGLMLNVVRRFPASERWLRDDRWAQAPFPLTASLRGRTLGILGLGRIGKAIAKRAEAFGLSIAYSGRAPQEGIAWPFHATARDLAAASDILMIAAPGGPATERIVDAAVLEALGPDGFLVNIARGSLVDEPALIAALKSGAIAGAGLDVYMGEPNPDPRFLDLDNVVLFPHVGSGTRATRRAMAVLLIENIDAWMRGDAPLTPVAESLLA